MLFSPEGGGDVAIMLLDDLSMTIYGFHSYLKILHHSNYEQSPTVRKDNESGPLTEPCGILFCGQC